MQELIEEFMAQKKFAVIGATDNPEKYGNRIVRDLKKRGYAVFPVNPRLKEVEGLTCYPTISDVPEKVDVADFVTPASRDGAGPERVQETRTGPDLAAARGRERSRHRVLPPERYEGGTRYLRHDELTERTS